MPIGVMVSSFEEVVRNNLDSDVVYVVYNSFMDDFYPEGFLGNGIEARNKLKLILNKIETWEVCHMCVVPKEIVNGHIDFLRAIPMGDLVG